MDDFKRGFLSLVFSQNLGVIKTLQGHADTVAIALDRLDLPEVLGTIAGDDTILVILKESENRDSFMEKLVDMMGDLEALVMKVAVFGASGYGGQILMRLLMDHPEVTAVLPVSSSAAGNLVDERDPGLGPRPVRETSRRKTFPEPGSGRWRKTRCGFLRPAPRRVGGIL